MLPSRACFRFSSTDTKFKYNYYIYNLSKKPAIYLIAIELSQDDKQLYAITTNSLTVFSRDIITGQLSFLETHADNSNGIDGLYGNYSFSISPDDKNVYTISNLDSSLVTFSRDTISGALTFVNKVKVIDYWLGNAVYSTSSMICENDNLLFTIYWEHSLCSFARDSISGTIYSDTTIIDNQGASIDGLRGACFVEKSPDNRFLYVASNRDGVSTFKRDESTGEITQFQVIKDGLNGIDGINGATSICATSDNEYVLVTGKYDNALTVLYRTISDSLILHQSIYNNINSVEGLSYPSSVLISSNLKQVYVGSNEGICIFNFNTNTGYLSFYKLIDFFELFGYTIAADEIHITKSGKYLFAVSERCFTVFMFERNSLTGDLLFVDNISEGELDPIHQMHIDISKDDNYLYISNETKNRIRSFKINEQSNSLELIQVIDSNDINSLYINSVSNIKVGQEDNLVFTTSSENSILVVYLRDINTGLLAYLYSFSEADDNFQGLDKPSSLILDASNKNIYITSSTENAISTYENNIILGVFPQNYSHKENFLIYPNPAQNSFNIGLLKQYSNINIVISNIQGQELINKSFKNQENITMDISNIPNQMYILKIKTDNSIEFQKIIKQ